MKESNHNKGFIALIAAVLISSVLLGLSSTIGVVSWYARLGVKEGEEHRLASLRAESCIDVALLRLAEQFRYNQPNEIIPVGEESCELLAVTYGTQQSQRVPATITARAHVGAAVTTLVVQVGVINPSVEPPFGEPAMQITSWQEM